MQVVHEGYASLRLACRLYNNDKRMYVLEVWLKFILSLGLALALCATGMVS